MGAKKEELTSNIQTVVYTGMATTKHFTGCSKAICMNRVTEHPDIDRKYSQILPSVGLGLIIFIIVTLPTFTNIQFKKNYITAQLNGLTMS